MSREEKNFWAVTDKVAAAHTAEYLFTAPKRRSVPPETKPCGTTLPPDCRAVPLAALTISLSLGVIGPAFCARRHDGDGERTPVLGGLRKKHEKRTGIPKGRRRSPGVGRHEGVGDL